MKSIPDRWLQYKAHGTVIESPKVLAFKVPLKLTVAKNLPADEQFTTASLMEAFPKLKFVIDLTNTNRYYDKNDFASRDIKHMKIMVPGKQVPPESCVLKFFKAMDTFLSAAKNDEIIGVHCTHGLNRTGYLVCRYMVQQLGWDLDAALKAFEEARGHKIERKEYVDNLRLVKSAEKLDTSKIVIQEQSNPRSRVNHKPKANKPKAPLTNWRDHPPIVPGLAPRPMRPGPRPNLTNLKRRHERTRWEQMPPFPPSSYPIPPCPNFPPPLQRNDIKLRPDMMNPSQSRPPYRMDPNSFRMPPPPPMRPLPYRLPDPRFRGPRPPLPNFIRPNAPRHMSHHWPSKNQFMNGTDNLRSTSTYLPPGGRDPGASTSDIDFKNDSYESNFCGPMIPKWKQVPPRKRKT